MTRRATQALATTGLMTVLAVGEAGCAGVRVYSDPGMKSETGVKVFAPKPYLLVSRTGAKDKPIDLSIVYLPNIADALYIKQRGGWGSNDLSVKVSNGILTEFGTKSDSKIPESLTAVGSLLSAAAGAYKTVQEGTKVRDESASREALDAAAAALKLIAEELVKVTAAGTVATAPQTADAKRLGDALTAAAVTLSDPTKRNEVDATVSTLKTIAKAMDRLKLDNPAPGNDPVTSYNSRIDTLKSQLQHVIDTISPESPQPATFELYEIVQANGKTRLVRAEVGP